MDVHRLSAGVAALLRDRTGWRLETGRDGYWHFGLEGVSRLVVRIEGTPGVVLYIAKPVDDTVRLGTVEALRQWLNLHESEYEGFTPLQTELLGHLLPGEIEKWEGGSGGSAS